VIGAAGASPRPRARPFLFFSPSLSLSFLLYIVFSSLSLRRRQLARAASAAAAAAGHTRMGASSRAAIAAAAAARTPHDHCRCNRPTLREISRSRLARISLTQHSYPVRDRLIRLHPGASASRSPASFCIDVRAHVEPLRPGASPAVAGVGPLQLSQQRRRMNRIAKQTPSHRFPLRSDSLESSAQQRRRGRRRPHPTAVSASSESPQTPWPRA